MQDSSPPPESVINPVVHDVIARHAYELWEREGSGHGSHERHWMEAEKQFYEARASEPIPTFPPSQAGHPVSRPD